MHPILFKIGNYPVHSFGVLIVIAFLLALAVAKKRAPKYGLNPDQFADACLATLFVGVLGARVVFILQELGYYRQHLNELFSLQFAGLTSFGGLLFGFAYLAFWARRKSVPFIAILDTMAVPLLIGQAVGRVGCLLNGCCYGGPTHAAWGVHVADDALLHHPAQIYESGMDLLAIGLLLLIERRGLAKGQSFALGFAFYGLARFFYEFWRLGSSSTTLPGLPISDAQVVAMAMAIIGFGLFIRYRQRTAIGQEISA